MRAELLRKISKEFNHFRSPECRARIIENGEKTIKIEFSGTSASFSCCFDEHFEDYRIMMEEAGTKTKIERVERKGIEKFIVSYMRHE